MAWQDRIVADPEILVGKPIVKGTRISVEIVIDCLAAGWSEQQILASYPTLQPDDIRACLAYAGELVREDRMYPLKTA